MSRIESEAMTMLLQRRQALRKGRLVPAGPDDGHALAVADAGEGADPVRRELAEIDAALRRIDAGSYGTCFACGGPLGLQRIRAFPEARYCVGCSGQPSDED